MAKKKKTPTKLDDTLVLHHYLLHLFGVGSLEALAGRLKDAELEGYDERNVSRLHTELVRTLPREGKRHLTNAELLGYDLNIFRHTRAINRERERPIRWKYFQYFALLFTEIYLDRYFHDRAALRADLNDYLQIFNRERSLALAPYTPDELNKLAFWNATGSGKTLVMHVNVRQYRHYQEKYRQSTDRTLLITPDEGLSRQHVEELHASGLNGATFSKTGGGLFTDPERIDVIEITKIGDTSGEKTVAVEAFETNNLVLIDEGHRGINGEQWKRMRDRLSQDGFAFEYSATFGQAVSAASRKDRAVLLEEYGKSILFDYSYRYFYADGFGKEFRILNIGPAMDEGAAHRQYLTGALLTFYQQKLLYATEGVAAATYLLADPLWVFVGNSVNAVRRENKRDVSDVLAIIFFLAEFIAEPVRAKADIQQLLAGTGTLVDDKGRSVFADSFKHLNGSAEGIYADVLARVFGGAAAGAKLVVEKLGADGELGLRIGAAEDYFGVISIGDVSKFKKLAEANGMEVGDKEFAGSLFEGINEEGSPVTVLIGANKFTTGWSSWRVSTMGLMNVGRGEGSKIIQLFGRGVRLRGYDFSLKRSSALAPGQGPDIAVPEALPLLETLNIFGIRSDYMAQFREYLKNEGVPLNDGNWEEIILPVMPTLQLEKPKLKILAPDEAADYHRAERLELTSEPYRKNQAPVVLDWFTRVAAVASGADGDVAVVAEKQAVDLNAEHLALVDWPTVYLELQAYKYDKNYDNCYFTTATLRAIMDRPEHYELYLPPATLETLGVAAIRRRQEVVTAVLKAYLDRFYAYHRAGYEAKHLKLRELTEEHDNFYEQYQIEVDRGQHQIVEALLEAKEIFSQVEDRDGFTVGTPDFSIITFLRHLYQPLLYLGQGRINDVVKISPVALNTGEQEFVLDLKSFYTVEQRKEQDSFFADRQLYLLRNRSRKGVGFFEANNFYPDFILWLVEGDFQYIAFVDPKGLRNINGLDNPKLSFYDKVGEIEERLGDPDVSLSSFIVSNTSYGDLAHWKGQEKLADFNDYNVYFQREQRGVYIELMLAKLVRGEKNE